MRTAISRARLAERESSRLATFAHSDEQHEANRAKRARVPGFLRDPLRRRQPAQKGRVDEREPHRIDAHPQGDCHDGGGREPAFFSDEPGGEAEIAQQVG